ncbi:hypothetical protein LguiA_028353 [Lonicera macranthoides]
MGRPKRRKSGAPVASAVIIVSNLSDTESCGDQFTEEEHATQLPPVVGRACRKSKKQVDEELNDSEQTSPRPLRCRGQSKRRMNCNDTNAQQQEKLNSNTLELYLESHWSLLVFCNFGEDINSETTTPCMLLLDSMQLAEPKRLEPGIRKFVLDIYKSEERPEDKKLIYKIPLLIPKVPQQRNGEECGNYVLYYMNLFMEHAPENFSLSEGYPYFMKEDWFTTEDMENFHKRLESYCE